MRQFKTYGIYGVKDSMVVCQVNLMNMSDYMNNNDFRKEVDNKDVS